MTLLFRACRTASVPECPFPLSKTSPRGGKVVFRRQPTGVRVPAASVLFETSLGTIFGCEGSRCVCKVTVRGLGGNFDPKVGPKIRHGAQKVPQKTSKTYFVELLCVALGRRCEQICTLREPHYLACFNFILRVLARSFSPSKWTRECNVHQKLSF